MTWNWIKRTARINVLTFFLITKENLQKFISNLVFMTKSSHCCRLNSSFKWSICEVSLKVETTLCGCCLPSSLLGIAGNFRIYADPLTARILPQPGHEWRQFFLKMADEFKMQNVTYLIEAEGEDLEGDVIVDESQLHRLEYTWRFKLLPVKQRFLNSQLRLSV